MILQVCHDHDQYICDFESDVSFDIDDKFLNYLTNEHEYNINSGTIMFELGCHVKQGDDDELYYEERVSVHVKVACPSEGKCEATDGRGVRQNFET